MWAQGALGAKAAGEKGFLAGSRTRWARKAERQGEEGGRGRADCAGFLGSGKGCGGGSGVICPAFL